MLIEDKRNDILMDFFHKLTFGMERKNYNGLNIGANVFIISFIGKMEECTMSDISRYFDFNASTITRRIEKLVKMNLLERHLVKNDRRLIRVRLTKLGYQIYSEILKRRISRFATLKTEFNEEELDIFFRILEFINEIPPSDNIAQM